MNTENPSIEHNRCPVNTTLAIIGGKWKVLIVHHLSDGAVRFNALRRLMPDISQRMLTLQLRELEQDGIVHREVYPEVPPRVEYWLTELGQTLLPVIAAMHGWGESYEKR
ncbi:MAG: helix-turn-helix domain-containing protein [Neisseria sp.]|nr:helix-turn-helix domain-containing protein [Neisseria sp.]